MSINMISKNEEKIYEEERVIKNPKKLIAE